MDRPIFASWTLKLKTFTLHPRRGRGEAIRGWSKMKDVLGGAFGIIIWVKTC